MKKIYPYILFAILFVQINVYAQIISYELVESWSEQEVSQVYSNYSIPASVGQINYGVDGYKVLYYTPDFNGELVICSGAIYLPSGINCPPPVLSWQHGTMSDNYYAPSNIGNTNNDLMGVICAANGYIVTMSDFIGLGEGEGMHNYVHANTEASATIDIIKYGKEIASEILGFPTNNQLFLFGYSQGGHATMATVKEIEANFSNELEITASAPMAGPYDMSESQRLMLESGEAYPNPGYLPYVLFAYNKIYNLYDDINEVLKSPYTTLADMYDGTYSMWDINNTMWDIGEEIYGINSNNFSPISIFKDEYYQEYLTNDNHPFQLALLDNDVYNFIPSAPMQLLHCSGDDNVTYDNAEVAYNYFIENGAENVELIDGGNFDHGECASIAIIGAKLWFDSMAELCDPNSSTHEFNKINKKIINKIDFLGRSITPENNTKKFIYIYNDGTTEKIAKLNK